MPMNADACYRAIATRDSRFDGRFFTAVHTTGIYCRPICPARTPKRANVTFYPSAAAAQEAGFRPCLRCRPESSPSLAAWRGTANTVSRGLALIEAGALDEGDVAALAGRLGVGERQLRRLFRQHLGASPIAVAQTQRVLLAKQLLHQTRLPMAEVAMASGFGSVRRFNETFRQLFDRPPAALRRQTGIDSNSPEQASPRKDGIRIDLAYHGAYDWDGLIAFLGQRAIAGVEAVTERSYARTIALDGVVGLVRVEPARKPGRLTATIHFPRLSALPTIIARIRRIFDLSADITAINRDLGRDPALAPRIAQRPGLRVPGAWDGLELAIRAILGQQITVAAAARLAERIARDWGTPLPEALAAAEPGLTHVFPAAARLALADLSGLPMPRSRSRALEGMARAVAANPALLEPRGTLEAVIAVLKDLPGIGEWTAHYIAMRQLREPDAFPRGDIGLLRAMIDQDGTRPSPAALQARAEAWRPWRAYAALHLWAGEIVPDPLTVSWPAKDAR